MATKPYIARIAIAVFPGIQDYQRSIAKYPGIQDYPRLIAVFESSADIPRSIVNNYKLHAMDELDELRIEHATATLAKGHAALEADPSAAYYHIWSARMLMITTKLKCTGELPNDDVHAIVRETDQVVTTHGVEFALERQNELLFLALAVGDTEGATNCLD